MFVLVVKLLEGKNLKRSKHNLSHYRLLTGDMGELLPIGKVEVIPGDSIQHATSMLVRASPLVTPPMHPVNIRVHHWFVPHRLVWDDFEAFITGGPDGMDASVLPTVEFAIGGVTEGSLADYLGVSPGVLAAGGREFSALPFRAYQLIWKEHYRDQDLMTAPVISTASGVDTTTDLALKNVAWEKDYFTTSRPWEQKGPTVTLPLGGSADVVVDRLFRVSDGVDMGSIETGAQVALRTAMMMNEGSATPGQAVEIRGTADLSGATAVDVNTVRDAFARQRFEEARARYGSRYTEYLRYLGVRSSDARLARPEYLGGGKQSLQFSEVLQTGSTTADPSGVGQLYGHGISAVRSHRYRRFFEEHGYVISVASVLPRTMYPQGIARTWLRRVKEDFYQRELEHIGQQPILNQELYAAHTDPDGTFGFQDRYDDYRRMESSVHGEFRTLLSDWHFARIFAADPVLNSSFVTANPAKRPFQSQSTDVLLFCAHHQVVARRLLASSGHSFIF